jgi:putative spermidine/putrescine transport system ATP-binding protein
MYGGLTAVDDLNLQVPGGEFLTLLGPSGSGKTTLLMMIAGFTQPTVGDIFVDDRRITHFAPERRNFGMVFQGYALFPHMTVAENVAYPLRVRGISRAEADSKIKAALALVRLGGFEGRYPKQLSGGQQQRVAIARALVFDPDILLFDEPLGALDRQLRAQVQVELKALHQRLGTTFIYVTHDQEEALSMSDRVAIFNRGKIVQAGAPGELYERPKTRFVAEFLGTSNCIKGQVIEQTRDNCRIQVGQCQIIHGSRPPSVGSEILLAVRPENLDLSPTEPVGSPNRVQGRILQAAYHGPTSQILVETEIGPMTVMCLAQRTQTELVLANPVWVSWSPEASVLLSE